MQLRADQDADAIYIRLRDMPYDHGHDLDPERRIDFAADGEPIGVELLCVSQGVDVTDLPPQIISLLQANGIKLTAVRR